MGLRAEASRQIHLALADEDESWTDLREQENVVATALAAAARLGGVGGCDTGLHGVAGYICVCPDAEDYREPARGLVITAFLG